MSGYSVRKWNSLFFYDQKNLSNLNNFKSLIIQKFTNGFLQTEKLHAENLRISLKLNNGARAICTSIENHLVVLEILINHEYDKSKALKSPNNYNDKDILASINSHKNELTEASPITILESNNRMIALDKTQGKIVADYNESLQNGPQTFIVKGMAGSGKTTIAQILSEQEKDSGKKILYTTKSDRLLNYIKQQHVKDSQEAEGNNGDLNFLTYQDLWQDSIGKDNFEADDTKTKENLKDYLSSKLYDVNKFSNWITQKSNWKKVKSKKLTISKASADLHKLYEDMIKVAAGQKLTKKNSFSNFNTEDVSKILQNYQDFLKNNKCLDLSIARREVASTNAAAAEEKYDLILVDESQDLSKQQLEHIYSLLSENGKIYYLMDGNQNLVDTFNLTPQYVYQIAPNAKEYSLNIAYRTPKNVTKLANKIIELKAHAVGGKLNKHEQQSSLSAASADDQPSEDDSLKSNVEEDGSVEWIDMQDAEKLAQLKTEAASSIECVIIIANESCRQNAEKEFPKGMIFTAEQIKGEEFAKILLFNFFSGKYEGNNFYEAGDRYDASNPMPSYYPKDLTNAHYAISFNKLFVGITRGTQSVVFVETGKPQKSNKDAKALYKAILAGQLQGTSTQLEASSLDYIMKKIIELHEKWEIDILLQHIAKATDLMHKDATTNSSTEIRHSKYLEHLNYFKTILISREISPEEQIFQNIDGLLVRFTPEEIEVTTNSLNSLSAQTSTTEKEENKNSKPTKKKKKNKTKTNLDSNNSQENKDIKAQEQIVTKNLSPKEKADILKQANKLFGALKEQPDLLEHECNGVPLLQSILIRKDLLTAATNNENFVKAITFKSLCMKNTHNNNLCFFQLAIMDPTTHDLLKKIFDLMESNNQIDNFLEYLNANKIDINTPDKGNQTFLFGLFNSKTLLPITKTLLSKEKFIEMITKDGLCRKRDLDDASALKSLFTTDVFNQDEDLYKTENNTFLKNLFIKNAFWKKISSNILNEPISKKDSTIMLTFLLSIKKEYIDIMKTLLLKEGFLKLITQDGLNNMSKNGHSSLSALISKYEYEDILPTLVNNDMFLNLLTSKGINDLNFKGQSCLHELAKVEDLHNTMIILASKNQFINILTLEGMSTKDTEGKSFLDYLEDDAKVDKIRTKTNEPDIKPLNILLQNEIFRNKIGDAKLQELTSQEWYQETIDPSHIDYINSLISKYSKEPLTTKKDCNNNLIEAAKKGDLALVKKCLQDNADVNYQSDYGTTSLHIAANNNNIELARLLLRSGADINAKDNEEEAPINVALIAQNIDMFHILIDAGANINENCFRQASAIGQISPNILEGLLKILESSILAKDLVTGEAGWLEHDFTIGRKLRNPDNLDYELVKEKLKKFTNKEKCTSNDRIKTKDFINQNIANYFDKYLSPENKTKLIECNNELFAKTQKNLNDNLIKAATKNNLDVVKSFIEKGADVNTQNHNGSTPLYLSAYSNHKELVKLLIESGADVNIQDKIGISPLYIAVHNGYINIVKLLIEASADINLQDDHGVAPLYNAAHLGNEELAKLLINAGADINTSNKDGLSPLCVATHNGHEEIVKLLIDAGSDINTLNNNGISLLCIATYNSHEEIIKLLIDAGADVNIQDKNNGITPLYIAAQNGYDKIAKLLIDAGSEVNTTDPTGLSALAVAAQNSYEKIVKLLIDTGADVNRPNNNGTSPLYVAAQNGHYKVIKLLVNAGADVNIQDEHGISPLYIAAHNGYDKVIKLLIGAGADVNTTSQTGLSTLGMTRRNGHEEAAKLLIEAGAKDFVDNNKFEQHGFAHLISNSNEETLDTEQPLAGDGPDNNID